MIALFGRCLQNWQLHYRYTVLSKNTKDFSYYIETLIFNIYIYIEFIELNKQKSMCVLKFKWVYGDET